MSTADEASKIQLPVDPGLLESRALDKKSGPVRWGAVIAAILSHATILIVLNLPDRWLAQPQPVPPPAIPVTLVQEPPAPPPPQPAPQPKPKPSPPQQKDLQSGPDQQTTAPPKEADKGPEAAPEAAAPAENAVKSPTGEARPKEAPTPQKAKPKVATRETAPDNKHGSVDRAPGEEHQGDPYLNELWAMIERHRFYPANAVGSLGLRLDGTAVYLIALRPDGQLQGLRLERSSGADVIDQTVATMIQRAAPFPPLPAYYPRGGVVLSVTIRILPP